MKNASKQTFKIFWRHSANYKRLVFLILGALIAGAVLGVIIPLFYGEFFNQLAGGGDAKDIAADLITILLYILGLNFLQWAFWRVISFGMIYFQPRVMANLANTCFDHLHHHSYRFFVNNFTGSLVKRVNRFVRAFEKLTDMFLFDLGTLAVETAVILIVLGFINFYLALILFVWVFIFIVFNYFFSRWKFKYDLKANIADTKVTARLADTIANSITIKLFSGFNFESRSFRKITDRQFRLTRFSWQLGGWMEAGQAFLMVGLEFLMFYMGVRLWQQGVLPVGFFVVMQMYIIRLMRKLWDFGRIIRHIYEELASAAEMTEILDTDYEIKDMPNAQELAVTRGEIEFKNVRFGYRKGLNIFPEMSLRIKPQEKVAIIGPSGGGKSTFVKLLFRFFETKKGSIYIDKQNIKQVTLDSLHQAISLVPQDLILFHRSLKENIRYGRRKALDKEVIAAAKMAHCHDFIKNLPQGYNTLVGERGIKLSGGERQRVAIARAILKNASILVLDEATSSLDSQSEQMIQDGLNTLMQGKTVIIIAHRLSTIMKMDRIIVIKNGMVEEEGTHGQLLNKNNSLYQQLWELQAAGFVQV
ncbi:MAG: ABC transporter ATP-binding protein [Candidatus Falkowbacteria bacterium]